MTSNVWVAGNDIDNEGIWKWADHSEPMIYKLACEPTRQLEWRAALYDLLLGRGSRCLGR